MNNYLITPLAPLVLRGGKPVDANTGDDVLVFPQPSTLAGALRGAYAIQANEDFATQREIIEKRAAKGPLLAAVNGTQITPLFAKPNDVFYSKPNTDDKHDLRLHRLVPQAVQANEGSDLPAGLQPVFFQQPTKSKPVTGVAWWTQENMTRWLCAEMPGTKTDKQGISNIKTNALGFMQLPTDVRYHVALDRKTLASEPGLLYQSAGRDFAALRAEQGGWQAEHYALLAQFEESIEHGTLRVGGEGRLSALTAGDAWPQMPERLRQALRGKKHKGVKHLRLILQTPALFKAGWRPDWLDEHTLTGEHPCIAGLQLKLCAAAVERWQAISGWDMRHNKPKAVRRLVPAGSVYWFEVIGNTFKDWDKLWLSSLCEDENDRNNGFGLAVPGVWQ